MRDANFRKILGCLKNVQILKTLVYNHGGEKFWKNKKCLSVCWNSSSLERSSKKMQPEMFYFKKVVCIRGRNF